MNITTILKKYIFKIFEIKESELNKSILLFTYIFLVITTLMIVKPTINSLFLSELDSKALPLGYILTALIAIIGSYFYTKALERRALNKIIEETLIISIISLLIFGIGFSLNIIKGPALYIPYTWVAIFGLLTASQFWILSNLVYNVREAKRVFGFIGAGAIAGGIFGGYLTSLLTQFIEAEALLFIAAFFLFFCIPIARIVWKKEVMKLSDFQIVIRIETDAKNPLGLIKKSRLLYLIAIVTGLSVLVAKLVDFQFSDYASRLIEDPEELASFFGFWFSNLSIVAFLIQLFLTKKIVGMFGVGKSLLWLPSGILVGSIVLLILPQLWVVVFIKIFDGGLKQSVNKAATELLSLPIPIHIKKKTKTFIDVVVDSIATGLAGIILIFFINGLKIHGVYVSLIIIVLISVWIYFIFQLREEYINSFKNLFLKDYQAKKKEAKTVIPIVSIIDSVHKVLTKGTEEQILYMLKKTLEVKDERFFKPIKALLNHPSAKVKKEAIENLYALNSENLCDLIEPMVHDPNQELTTAAFRYLLKNYTSDPVKLFDKYLNSADQTISNAALIGLSLELRNDYKLQEAFNLNSIIEKTINQYNESIEFEGKSNRIIAILQVIGNAKITGYYSLLHEHLSNEDSRICKAAIKSAAATLDSQFIETLVKLLARKDIREDIKSALYSYGELIIDILVSDIKDGNINTDEAQYIPNVIERFHSQNAIKALIKLTDKTEHHIKIEAIESLRKLKWNHQHLKIKEHLIIERILDECELYQNTLAVLHSQIVLQYKGNSQEGETQNETEARKGLISLLENRLDRQLKRIFKFLGMKYPPDEIDSILEVILTGKNEQQVHAIEFLDNILNLNLKSILIPIIETAMMDNSSKDVLKIIGKENLSEYQCFENILMGRDTKLKFAVLYLIEQESDNTYLPLLKSINTDEDLKFKNARIKVIDIIEQKIKV